MITLLAKIFIKGNQNFGDSSVRQKYGVLCGGFGIFLNIVLFAAKFIFGLLAASVAMIADAFNNLSDAAASLVQLLGFKLASKKPDSEHPFGHGRLEYISGLIISFLILLMGFELLKSSVESLINPKPVNANFVSVIILVGTIFVKVYMYFYNHRIAKKIDSVAMEATAKDSLSDVISTAVVILSIVVSRFVDFPVDGIAGIVVGFCILKTGYEAAKDTIEPLLGTAPSKEFVEELENEVLSHKPIVAIHDLVVHDYGPGRLMISLHAEVPGDMDIFELHEVIDDTEVSVSNKFNCAVVIHMDPIDINNPLLDEIKTMLAAELPNVTEGLHAHDVRIVTGQNHSNLIFDVVKPFECKLSDEELKGQIKKLVKTHYQTINCVITVDTPFV